MAYGACDSKDAPRARRISYLIGPDGRIVMVYSEVQTAVHPEEALKTVA